MTPIESPIQLPAQPITGEWSALPSWLPVPGMGVLAVNAFLLKGREPMLVDTGLAALSDDLLAQLAAEIDLEDLRWIWLSHTDPDHVGNLDRILGAAPQARVITNFLGAGKLGMMGKGSPDRLRLLEPDEVLEIGDRRFHQVRPPYFDAPETMGFFDATDRVLFAADAFGALLPGIVGSLDEIPQNALRDGLVGWSSIDAPWLTQIDRSALAKVLQGLERLDPAYVLSGHLPSARGLDRLAGEIRTAYGRGATGDVTAEAADRLATVLS